MMMEILEELLLTALLSVLFAVFLARLVSFAAETRAAGGGAGRTVGAALEEVIGEEENLGGDSDGKVVEVEEEERGSREWVEEKPVAEEEEVLEKARDGCGGLGHVLGFEEDGSAEVKGGNLELEDGALGAEDLEEEKDKCSDLNDETNEVKDGCFEEDLEAMEVGGGSGGGDEEQIGGEVGFGGEDGAEGGEERLLSEGDDDWEGIEKSELEERFGSVSKKLASGAGDVLLAKVGSDVQMLLYGLHKVATEGPCYEPPPSVLKSSARAKWNAWQRLGNMNQETAMEEYITLLNESIPGWEEKRLGENDKKEGDHFQVPSESKATDLNSSPAIQLASDAERKPEIHPSAEGDDGGSPVGGLTFYKQDSQ